MARPHYHRDLIGTTLTIAGVALVGVSLCAGAGVVVNLVAFGLASCLAVFLARQIYPELAMFEAVFAAALVIAAVFGVATWQFRHLGWSDEILVRIGIAVACGAAGATLGCLLPRRAGAPHAWVAGFIAISAHLVPLAIVLAIDDDHDSIAGLAVLLGGIFGGMVAVRIVPGVRVGQVAAGSFVVMTILAGGASLIHAQWQLAIASTIGAAFATLFDAFGAWIARPRSDGVEVTLPTARTNERS